MLQQRAPSARPKGASFVADSEPERLWVIPESRLVGGLAARPAEYERRVIGFFDDALAGMSRDLNVPAGCAKLQRP
jgi:hypothetical protein